VGEAEGLNSLKSASPAWRQLIDSWVGRALLVCLSEVALPDLNSSR